MVGRDSRCGAATRLRGVRCPRRRGLRRVPGAAGQDGGVRHAGHIHGSGIRVCMVQGRGASGDSGVEGPSRRGMRRAAVRGDGRAGRPVSAGDGGRDAYRPGGSGAVLIGFGAPAGTAAYRRAGGCRGASVSGYGGRCACGSPAHDGPCPRTVRADGRRSAQPARQRAHPRCGSASTRSDPPAHRSSPACPWPIRRNRMPLRFGIRLREMILRQPDLEIGAAGIVYHGDGAAVQLRRPSCDGQP